MSGLPVGVYGLDVTVFITDGTRAGSESCGFSIVDNTATRDNYDIYISGIKIFGTGGTSRRAHDWTNGVKTDLFTHESLCHDINIYNDDMYTAVRAHSSSDQIFYNDWSYQELTTNPKTPQNP